MRTILTALAILAAAIVSGALLGSTVPGMRFIGIPATAAFLGWIVVLASKHARTIVDAAHA